MTNDEQGTPDDSACMDGAPKAGQGLAAHAQTPVRGEAPPVPASGVDSGKQGGIAAPVAGDWQPSDKSLIFATGKIGYDFGTQARMDHFIQSMEMDQSPFNAGELLDFLAKREAETRMLIWTLNIDMTQVYAIEPGEPFARDTYALLTRALEGQLKGDGSTASIARASIPGYLTKSVRLYSGRVVPVVSALACGLHYHDVDKVIGDAVKVAGANLPPERVAKLRSGLRGFLNQLDYHVRNMGMWSSDRAVNFVALNAVTVKTFAQDLLADSSGGIRQLDRITVEKSPSCRPDSDYWDVKLAFVDPENYRRAMRIVCYTIDVSDVIPVMIGEPKSWDTSKV